MKHQNLSYFSVGLFVILMFVALMGTLYYLTGRTGAAEDYFVYYQDVAGLEKGSPVTYRGYRVGRVDRIKPDFDDNQVRYQVTLSIRKGWPLSADSTARILSSGLLAAVHIDIQGGSSPEMLEPGATLAGREAVSLFAALDSIAAEADHLVDDGIMPVLKNLNDRINGIADPLQAGAETVMEDFKVAAATLKTKVGGLSGDVETLVQRLNNSAAALEQAFDEKNLEHFDAFMEKMDTTAGNLKTL
ncbi:MAG: MlaD family protein, partial [Pseudomonadota bacterium]